MAPTILDAIRIYKQRNPTATKTEFKDIKAIFDSLSSQGGQASVLRSGTAVKAKPATDEQRKRFSMPESVQFSLREVSPTIGDVLPIGEDWEITGYVDKKTGTIYNNVQRHLEIGRFEGENPVIDTAMLKDIWNGFGDMREWRYKYPPYLEYEEKTE